MMRQLRPQPLAWLAALVLSLMLVLLGPGAPLALAGPVDWREVPANADGRQWWDAGSLHRSRSGQLSVLSRFQPADAESGEGRRLGDLYVMELDCGQRLYRDTSVNGWPHPRAEWQPVDGDGLLEAVLDASCEAGAPLLQAG